MLGLANLHGGLLITWLALSAPTWACGGFFCNNAEPVDQSGETIVFGVEDGEITTHVRIAYTGAAEDFAWVLPVPGVPDVFLSTEALFDTLERSTVLQPQVQLDTTGPCITGETDADSDTDSDSDSDVDTGPGYGGVDVLVEAPVGPYDTVVLQATSSVVLVDWLQDNGYAVPDALAGSIDPYLASGMNFLALKLQKTETTGSLAPLGVRWAGDRPSVPLRLTAVAATPDMPLTVHVLGPHRAVPLSWLHVRLNPLAWNFFGDGPDLRRRLAQAADEAGGIAFATTHAGENTAVVYVDGSLSTVGLAQITDPLRWFMELQYRGFPATSELMEVLRTHVPAPDGIDENTFYNATYAYSEEWAALAATFDPVAATADIETRIVEPLETAQSLLDAFPYLTRLDTVLSPEEMTVDPMFGFNPDLPDVSRFPTATLHTTCSDSGAVTDRSLTVDGYTVEVPTNEALGSRGLGSWLDGRIGHVALVIEQLSESGQGERLADFSEELADAAALDATDPPIGSAGCGCGNASGPAGVWMGVALGAVLRRRASQRSRNATIREAASS